MSVGVLAADPDRWAEEPSSAVENFMIRGECNSGVFGLQGYSKPGHRESARQIGSGDQGVQPTFTC